MTDEERFNNLRNHVLARVREERNADNRKHPKILGFFLQVVFERKRLTPAVAARETGIPVPVIELILQGELPRWMLIDEVLHRLAWVTDYEYELLFDMIHHDRPDNSLERAGRNG